MKETVKIHGVHFSYNKKLEQEKNFQRHIIDTENVLRPWLMRNLMKVRSSTGSVLWKKVLLKNFLKFTGKHLCQSHFLNKVEGLRTATLLKKRLARCFQVNFARFSRTPFHRAPLGECLCKVLFFESLAISKIVHLSLTRTVPHAIINHLNIIQKNFLWNGNFIWSTFK